MKKIVLSLWLAILVPNISYSKEPNGPETYRLVKKMLDEVNKSFTPVKTSGEKRFKRFMALYVYGKQPGYVDIEFNKYINQVTSEDHEPLLSLKQATKLTRAIVSISKAEPYLLKNDYNDGSPLFRQISFYSIGVLMALHRIERVNPESIDALTALKNQLTYAFSPYLVRVYSDTGLNSWETIYLHLIHTHHSNYDSHITSNLARFLVWRIQDEKAQKYEIEAAHDLLLEISMICISQCSKPSPNRNSHNIQSTNFYIKRVLSSCYDNCREGVGANPKYSGFYSSYLRYLQSTSDPDYESIKAELVWKSFSETLAATKEAFTTLFKTTTFKQTFFLILTASLYLVAYITHYAPAYWVVGIASVFFITFAGKEKYRFNKGIFQPSKIPSNRVHAVASKTIHLFMGTILSIFEILATFFRNATRHLCGSADPFYNIPFTLLAISLTLALNDLYSYIESTLRF